MDHIIFSGVQQLTKPAVERNAAKFAQVYVPAKLADIIIQETGTTGKRAKIDLETLRIDSPHKIQCTHFGSATIHTAKNVKDADAHVLLDFATLGSRFKMPL